MLLYTHRWRDEVRSLLTWSITAGLVAFFGLLLSMVFVNVGETQRILTEWLENIPPAFRSLVGGQMQLSSINDFITGMIVNTVLPALVLVYACLSATGIYTKDASAGNLEFLFTLPIKRLHLVAGRVLVFLTNLALIHAVTYLGAILSLAASNQSVDSLRLALVMLNQFLLFAAIGGLAFLISQTSTDYNKMLLITLAVFFGLFALNVFLDTQRGLPELLRSFGHFLQGKEGLSQDFLSMLNPFYYYKATPVLVEGLIPVWNLVVLTVATLASWAGGMRVYIRKQV